MPTTASGTPRWRGELPDLLLVEVAERVERARVVAEDGRVAEQDLGLVRGAERPARPSFFDWSKRIVMRSRAILLPRRTRSASRLLAVEVGVDLRRDVDRAQREAERSRRPPRRRRASCGSDVAVGQEEGVHPLGAERARRERGGERRVDAARETDHHALRAGGLDARRARSAASAAIGEPRRWSAMRAATSSRGGSFRPLDVAALGGEDRQPPAQAVDLAQVDARRPAGARRGRARAPAARRPGGRCGCRRCRSVPSSQPTRPQ